MLFPKTTQRFFEAGTKRDLVELFRITEFFMEVDNRLFAHCERDMIDGSFDKTFIWLQQREFLESGAAPIRWPERGRITDLSRSL